MIGIAIAFIVWIYVFKRGFKTGLIRALGISIAAIAVFVIIGIIIFFCGLSIYITYSTTNTKTTATNSCTTFDAISTSLTKRYSGTIIKELEVKSSVILSNISAY
jgi:hypothetical protein